MLTFYGYHLDSGIKNNKKTRRGMNKPSFSYSELTLDILDKLSERDLFYWDIFINSFLDYGVNPPDIFSFHKDPLGRLPSGKLPEFPQFQKGGFAYFGLFRRIHSKINKKKKICLSLIDVILNKKFNGFYVICEYTKSFLIDKKGLMIS